MSSIDGKGAMLVAISSITNCKKAHQPKLYPTNQVSTANLVEEPEPESISLDRSSSKADISGDKVLPSSNSPRQHRTKTSKRLSGRSAASSSGSNPYLHSSPGASSTRPASNPTPVRAIPGEPKVQDHVWRPDHANHIISQVAEWLQHEKAKQAARKSARERRHHARFAHATGATEAVADAVNHAETKLHRIRHKRNSSEGSDTELALGALERILSSTFKMDTGKVSGPTDDKSVLPSSQRKFLRRGSKLLRRKLSSGLCSDSETREDILVPSAEVALDNAKTPEYSRNSSTPQTDQARLSKRATKDQEAWLHFKSEVVRLTHTLKISGWRSVPIEQGKEIEVERLSGALTNAVYVVSPPKNLIQTLASTADSGISLPSKRQPRSVSSSHREFS